MHRITSEPTELLVDTHVHTHYSDGIASVPRIERYCGNRGIGVAVTDHNEIRGSASAFERERVPVIPGIEVGTEEGIDLLVYFPAAETLEDFFIDAVEPFLRTRFMVRSWIRTERCLSVAREMGAFVSLAHPFALGRKSLDYQHCRHGKPFVEAVMEAVDAIELYNGGIFRQANRRATHFAATAGKRLTVGSDSHRLGTIGSCGTYLPMPTGVAGRGSVVSAKRSEGRSARLFHALKHADDLRHKMKGSASTSTIPMFGLIALKHTHHFMRPTRRKKAGAGD
jgi:predicted metal-dependent phosphoesterase TrpH